MSNILNLFKGKGDILDRGNYRGLKLTEHVMKIRERIVDGLIREMIVIDEMQFAFVQSSRMKICQRRPKWPALSSSTQAIWAQRRPFYDPKQIYTSCSTIGIWWYFVPYLLNY